MQDYGSTGGGTGGTGGSGYGSTGSSGSGGLGDEGSTGSTGGGLSGTGSTGGGLSGTGSTGGDLGSTGGGLSGTGSTGGDLSGTGSTGGDLGGTGATRTSGLDDFGDLEPFYRRHHAATIVTPAEGSTTYEEARTGYEAGHRAAASPTYANKTYDEVEVEVQREYAPQGGRFEAVRGYARSAFTWKRVLGAVALAAGGYWASKRLFQAASEIGEEEERDCRVFYDAHPLRTTITYDQARTGYALGYVAARNPDYAGRSYDDIDTHLRTGYTGSRAGDYDQVRDFARRGYERGTSRTNS